MLILMNIGNHLFDFYQVKKFLCPLDVSPFSLYLLGGMDVFFRHHNNPWFCFSGLIVVGIIIFPSPQGMTKVRIFSYFSGFWSYVMSMQSLKNFKVGDLIDPRFPECFEYPHHKSLQVSHCKKLEGLCLHSTQ